MEDSPPAEDPKLREKLTDYFGNYQSADEMLQKIDSNHLVDIENAESLLKFASVFGHFDEITGKGLQTAFEITNNDKAEVSAKITESLNNLVNFKQIAQDRDIAAMKEKIQQEEIEQAKAEAAETAAQEAAH